MDHTLSSSNVNDNMHHLKLEQPKMRLEWKDEVNVQVNEGPKFNSKFSIFSLSLEILAGFSPNKTVNAAFSSDFQHL